MNILIQVAGVFIFLILIILALYAIGLYGKGRGATAIRDAFMWVFRKVGYVKDDGKGV